MLRPSALLLSKWNKYDIFILMRRQYKFINVKRYCCYAKTKLKFTILTVLLVDIIIIYFANLVLHRQTK